MGILNAGLSYWQAETDGESLLGVTIRDMLDQRATELPAMVVRIVRASIGGPKRWSR